MISLLGLASLRYFLRHPWPSLLAILGVAVGVAAALAVDLASTGALRSFEQSTATLNGFATHQIVDAADGVPESLYPALRLAAGTLPAAPVVEGSALRDGATGAGVRLIGLDPLAESAFRPFAPPFNQRNDAFGALLTRPGAAWITAEAAADWGVGLGDELSVHIGGRAHALTIVALLQPTDPVARVTLRQAVLLDLASAQELLGMTGRLSRIDLRLPAGGVERVSALLPAGVRLVGVTERVAGMVGLTDAFRANLTAMGLLAWLVGVFILFNAITFAMVQRRREVGLLRAVGVTRRGILARLLGDALLLGVPGALLGVGLGIGLGQVLVGLVTRTVNDLYFSVPLAPLPVDGLLLLKGAVLGVGGALLAALPAALEAAGAPPTAALARSALEAKTRALLPGATRLGWLLLAAGGVAALWPSHSLHWGLAALFALILGYALLVPAWCAAWLAAVRRPLARWLGWPGGLAAAGAERSLSRAGVAVAALTVAVATVVGMGLLIGSFRHSVITWLGHTLRSDIYVASAEVHPNGLRTPLDPELVARLRALPGVGQVGMVRRVPLETPAGRTDVVIYDIPRARFDGFQLLAGEREAAWRDFQAGSGVLVSEPMAYHRRLQVGDALPLPTADGERAFGIVGIYRDYGSGAGEVAIGYPGWQRHWGTIGMASMGIEVAAGAEPQRLMAAIEGVAARMATGPITIRSNQQVLEASVIIFDRTFAITRVLQTIALVVALVGVATALLALEWERGREWATLRALGVTPGELQKVALLECAALGSAAGLAALPLGLLQGVVLIEVVNKRGFGWGVTMQWDPWLLGQALLIAIPVAVLAGAYPAYRACRLPPARLLQEE